MNFKELIAKLGASTVKTLSEAKELLSEIGAGLSSATAEIDSLNERLSAAAIAKTDLEASLATSTAKVNELTTELASVQTGVIAQLAAVGVKVEKLEPESLKAALSARIEGEAQSLLAARGIKPLPEQIKPAGEIDAKLETDDQILAKYQAMPAGPERVAFLEKHEAAIWRAHSQG